MILEQIDIHSLQSQLTNSCSTIALSYGLKEPDFEFVKHLANTVKLYYKHITIEQFDDAFVANSLGLLNQNLGKSGMSIDNKVKFTIPDITKILKAYLTFKKINSPEAEKVDYLFEQRREIRIKWVREVNEIFEKYMNEFERTPITIPIYYCEKLAELGLLDKSKIDYSRQKIIIRFSRDKYQRRSENEDLIYKCFYELLDRGEILQPYLDKLLDINEMPY